MGGGEGGKCYFYDWILFGGMLKQADDMNQNEYANLSNVEETHWFYACKREVAKIWIDRVRRFGAEDVLLDYGAGTGRFAQEIARHCEVFVVDDHQHSQAMLRSRFPVDRVLILRDGKVPLPDGALDYVTALDVLEHTADDRAVVREFRRLLKPGGVALVTVPASMALWSDWDVGLHHYRRYSRAELRGLFPADEWRLEWVNYTNVPIYPLVWAVRKWRTRVGQANAAEGARAEDKLPPRWLNTLLYKQFVWLATVRCPMPIGVSLLLVATRR